MSLTVMRQQWRHLAFLHYEFDPAQVQATLPDGFRVHTFQNRAFVGLVPFRMMNVRPIGLPAVPKLSHFLETNVRTYVIAPNGQTGVWFYSLDAESPMACRIARATFGLPYFPAKMSLVRRGNEFEYHCQRGSISSKVVVSTGTELRTASPDSLEAFLLERYRLFALRKGVVMTGLVRHEPYTFSHVESALVEDRLVSAAGFQIAPGQAPAHAVWSPGVDVQITAPTRLSA
jgi:uncharacterized protein YqjF (DUF2071 family)